MNWPGVEFYFSLSSKIDPTFIKLVTNEKSDRFF